MKRSPMKRGTTRIGAAAKARRAAGGKRAAGRDSLPVSDWVVLKAALYHRARGRCENPLCRKAGALDAHHVVKASAGGEDTAENIVLLCRRCHDATDLVEDAHLGVALGPVPESYIFFLPNKDEAHYVRPAAEPNYPTKS
jgi:hypothetical protein